MKMFRVALAGALSAFVLFVCIQLNARVACTSPPQLDAAANVAAPSESRQLLGGSEKSHILSFLRDNADWRCENGIGIRSPMTLSASLAARVEVSRAMRLLFSLTNDRSPMKEVAR